MNAVVVAVLVMLVLSFARVHVVMALIIGSIVGGLLAGLGIEATMASFTAGMANGASIALSYAVLGAFAVAIAHSGLPQAFAGWVTRQAGSGGSPRRGLWLKWGLLAVVLAAAIMSQNVVPIHIAFIPLLIPPLLVAFNRFGVDRRALACILTFGLVTTYMYLPYGFGNVFLNEILLRNISNAGLDTSGINVLAAMGIPALGMVAGLLIAVFVTYRRPRRYEDLPVAGEEDTPQAGPVSAFRVGVALASVVLALVIQIWADSLLLGALVGFAVFLATGVVRWGESGSVFNRGIQMMAMIGFIMIAAQGFAQVMSDTGDVEPLVTTTAELFAGNRVIAAFVMLLVGLLVTMGIGSSFSTLPIIATIYVPLCLSLGFSPLATVALIGTA
ncbi:MAG: TRAP transporter large permease subunit, partial [Propionibacteriaceae bacterium]|nr:TRAP transporter large permease subunit [Propionibacteriaceae bacterium]